MKWGVRRWQNEDGTLTEAGKKRYDGDRAVAIKSKANASAAKAGKAAAVSAATAASIAKVGHDMRDMAPRRSDLSAAEMAVKYAYNEDDRAAQLAKYNQLLSQQTQFAAIGRAAASVASIVAGAGAVATIGYGAIAAGQLAYTAYLKHQIKKVQNKEA